ncbi:MAG: hypothetical protein VX265_14050, partial [Myxococcota bacterium]|nr:hypothetical protein [Myxococcota bacterium]
LEGMMAGDAMPAREVERTLEAGFRYLAVYPEYRAMPQTARSRLEACLGRPLAASREVWLFDLGAAPAAGCPASDTPPARH